MKIKEICMTEFEQEVNNRIKENKKNKELVKSAKSFLANSIIPKYSYNFSWLGRPIIQYPQDIVAIQEIIWSVKPDLIIETGIAHGGSIILSASMLAMLDLADAIEKNELITPANSERKVLGIDIDIREHNKIAIEKHPMFSRIEMIEGSSVDQKTIHKVHDFARNYKNILVLLDSNHTYEHVYEELKAYAPLVTKGSYCIVLDTIIEDVPSSTFPDRPWGPGNNPKTAVHKYLKENSSFVIDEEIENKLLITVCPDGYLKKIS